MTEPPQSPSEYRDEPYYIDDDCPDCGAVLVLYDDAHDFDGEPWYDEWWCPRCEDSIHMDWPDDQFEELKQRVSEAESEDFETIDDVEESFLDSPDSDGVLDENTEADDL